MLKDATVHFIQLYGQDSVYWNDIVALFTELLDREREHPEMVKLIRYTRKGSTMYRRFAFHAAVAPFIVKIGKTKKWNVIDPRGLVNTGQRTKSITDQVLKLVKPSSFVPV
jgi:hypothetical protein